MGLTIDRDQFEPADYRRFELRLEECLVALERLLGRPGFGTGPATVGAELELCLVDAQGRALPRNQEVRAETADPRVVLEIDRFNLELNLTPAPLAGRPFAAMASELDQALGIVRRAAAWHGGRVVMVGILPTLEPEDLQLAALSDAPRYRALNNGLRRLRQEPFQVRIDGADPLEVAADDVGLEGGQHLLPGPPAGRPRPVRRPLQRRPAGHRAGPGRGRQLPHLPRPPALAGDPGGPVQAGGRRPRRRRPLQPAAVPGSPSAPAGRRTGPLELLEESVRLHEPVLPVVGPEQPLALLEAGDGVPALEELRLHQGTVWRWNRAIYDPADGGHLRIEMRALPPGPTVIDMLANAAFLLGLTLALAPDAPAMVRRFAFQQAHHNFYRAAQFGLGAELAWPPASKGRARTLPAAELVRHLLPTARQGLEDAGVLAEEAGQLLSVIQARAASGQTGAAWQRQALAALEPRLGRERALTAMLEHYLEHQRTGEPVHTWPLPSSR